MEATLYSIYFSSYSEIIAQTWLDLLEHHVKRLEQNIGTKMAELDVI